MSVETVSVGGDVFKQGDMGSDFYIIRSGLVQVTIDDRRIRTLGKGDYFGERALLSAEPRSGSITAVEETELWKMGQETFTNIMQGGSILKYLTDRIALQDTKISMEDLLFMRVIGRGGFGVVKMACARRTRTRYALKCLRKRHIVEHEQQQELQNERSILAEVDHPFIIKYVRSFRSDTQVYLLTELVTGGELLDVLDVLGLLGRSQAQFYTGSLVLALEFLHARRIAYLDLKSENCMIDHQGYLKMIDFGIAQRITSGKCYNVKGTPMFMAPEMILAKGYTTAADLWSLGINLYEYMVGEFPFAKNSTNHAEIFKAVLKDPLRFPQWFKNQECSEDCQSFMKSLLTRDPTFLAKR
jgi:cGMP-dependent protein kinase